MQEQAWLGLKVAAWWLVHPLLLLLVVVMMTTEGVSAYEMPTAAAVAGSTCCSQTHCPAAGIPSASR
jgi:hypothetical protein